MRIVHVITRLIVGGAQENTLLSCEGQHRAGHDVTLITGPPRGPEGSLMPRAYAAGYRVEVTPLLVRPLSPLTDFRALAHLTQRFIALRPDIVHTHSSKAGILGRWAAWRANRLRRANRFRQRIRADHSQHQIVHTIHGLAFTASTSRLVNRCYEMAERVTAPISDAIVCVADAMSQQSLAANIGRPEQYSTVHSGMDVEPFLNPPVARDEIRRSLGINATDVVVGTIARLFELKGHEDLIELAPELCAKHPQLKFLWVGDGILRPRYERQIQAMRLQDRFVLTGLVPPTRIPELCGAMDILVHPSRREGLARALPQGGLARCPVITYDIDGNAEAIEQDITGVAIRAFDVQALGAALSKVIEDADLRQRMGNAGRERALRIFSAKTMVDRLDELYSRLTATLAPDSNAAAIASSIE